MTINRKLYDRAIKVRNALRKRHGFKVQPKCLRPMGKIRMQNWLKARCDTDYRYFDDSDGGMDRYELHLMQRKERKYWIQFGVPVA